MKYVRKEQTRRVRESITIFGQHYCDYQYYAYHYKCVKCGKETIAEKRFIAREKQTKKTK